MRLINVQNLELKEFFGDDIPPYAILSHTWGSAGDEVSFRDISSHNESSSRTMREKPGFKKIKLLTVQAKRDGIKWAWCDTCCIAKESSAELSESINSMYKWYENAKVCYAYLSDVVEDRDSVKNMVEQVKKSRWFRRGWTLQELLAPKHVEFYIRSSGGSSNWVLLGSKERLHSLLSMSTGISMGVLKEPGTIPSYSIATRMSWAASRMTSRIEDRAYCMLGILGVHMPLLYGEGANAFRRLQEELIKSSDDESVFAHSGPNILAEGPEAYIASQNVFLLQRTVAAIPFSITNMGLNMQLRIFDPRSAREDRESRRCGILNCHNRDDFKHFLAIPLQTTTMPDTFIRAPGELQLVPESDAAKSEMRVVFIRQRPPQISRITCLLEHRGLIDYKFDCFANSSSERVRESPDGQVNVYINPNSSFGLEWVQYSFRTQSRDGPFDVLVIFDLAQDTAGVLMYPVQSSLASLSTEELLGKWEDDQKPKAAKVHITTSGDDDESYMVRAEIKRKERLKQNVWVLEVWKCNADGNEGSPSRTMLSSFLSVKDSVASIMHIS